MTKELSKQLCELCGVEPHHYETELQIENNKVVETIKRLKYPDFGKPNNFVKLLESIATIEDFDIHFSMALNPVTSSYTQSVTINDISGNIGCSNKSFKHGFLEALCQLAKEDKDLQEYIKNTEWEY